MVVVKGSASEASIAWEEDLGGRMKVLGVRWEAGAKGEKRGTERVFNSSLS